MTRMPPRATLLARDRTVLAKGDDRASPLAAGRAAGRRPARARSRPSAARSSRALGVPADAEVGVSGLERIFDERLLGTPGRRARRRRARAQAHAPAPGAGGAHDDLAAGRAGGGRPRSAPAWAASSPLKPRTGEVLAFAGIAFSGLQPPGSTFKMITTTGALEAGITNPPKHLSRPAEGDARGRRPRERQRRVLRRLAASSPSRSRATRSSPRSAPSSAPSAWSPPPSATASTAARHPGRGREHDPGRRRDRRRPRGRLVGDRPGPRAGHGAADGDGRGDHRPARPPAAPHARLRRRARPRRGTERATSPRVARTMERLMLAVVRGGTGHARGDPGRAGRGQDRHRRAAHDQACQPDPRTPSRCPPEDQANDPTDTDAWFAAYAPAGTGRPRSRSACCSSARGPAATPRRPRRATSCSGLKATAEPALGVGRA